MTTYYRKMKVKDDNSPCARWGHSMVAVNGVIYLFGGYQNANYMNDLWVFDLKINQFQKHIAFGNIPPPCSSFSFNYYPARNSLILFAGGTHNKTKLSGLYQLDLHRFKWTEIKRSEEEIGPCHRSYHTAEIIGDNLVVFGGEYVQELSDTWVYNFNTKLWNQIKNVACTLKPKPAKFVSSFAYKNRFYVLGGSIKSADNVDQVIYLDFNRYLVSNSEDDLVWSKAEFKDEHLLKRWGAVSLIFGDYAYVYGGRSGNVDLQNLVQIDLKMGVCRELSILSQIPAGRRKPSACIHNHNLFIFNGFNGQYKASYGYFQLPFHLEAFGQDPNMKENPQKCQNIDNGIINKHFQQNLSLQKLIFDLKLYQEYKYFECVLSNNYKNQLFTLYPLQYFAQCKRQKLMKIFTYFLKYNKLVFNQTQKELIFSYTQDLITLSQYFCIQKLEIACKKQLMKLFSEQTMCKNQLSHYFFKLIDFIVSIDNQYREYVGFITVKRILLENYREVRHFVDFENICKTIYEGRNMNWIHQMIQKYRFELSEIINGNDPFVTEMEKRMEILRIDSNGLKRTVERYNA